jgi:hypothetical protein
MAPNGNTSLPPGRSSCTKLRGTSVREAPTWIASKQLVPCSSGGSDQNRSGQSAESKSVSEGTWLNQAHCTAASPQTPAAAQRAGVDKAGVAGHYATRVAPRFSAFWLKCIAQILAAALQSIFANSVKEQVRRTSAVSYRLAIKIALLSCQCSACCCPQHTYTAPLTGHDIADSYIHSVAQLWYACADAGPRPLHKLGLLL